MKTAKVNFLVDEHGSAVALYVDGNLAAVSSSTRAQLLTPESFLTHALPLVLGPRMAATPKPQAIWSTWIATTSNLPRLFTEIPASAFVANRPECKADTRL